MTPVARASAACLMLFCSSASAADDTGRFVVEGVGRIDCARFLDEQSKNSPVFHAVFGWIDGYSTAFNTLRPDTFDVTPWETTELLLLKLSHHCGTRPQDRIGDAVAALFRTLEPNRLQAWSEPSQARNGDSVVVLYTEVFRRIGAALTKLGLLPEGDRQVFDQAMGLALMEFQRGAGLPASGLPDQPTLNALLR